MKYADFKLITRSNTANQLLARQSQLLELLPDLLRKTQVGGRPIRLIGISVSNLQAIKVEGDHCKVSEEAINTQLGLF